MLVISRRVGEEIIVGGQIRVVVAAVKGNRVRLAISAPPSVTVDRPEVYLARSLPQAGLEATLAALAEG